MNQTPLYEVFLHKNVLKALSLFQSSDATRYVLNAICIEVNPKSEDIADVCYIATDGRVLAVYNDNTAEFAYQDEIRPPAHRFIFDFAKYLKHFKGGRLLVRVYQGEQSVTLEVLDEHQKVCVRDTAVNGNYPAWRQIFPDRVESPTAAKSVAPQFLSKFTKAAELLDGKANAAVHLVGYAMPDKDEPDRSAYTVYCQDAGFAGVLMPLKESARHLTHGVPSFCQKEHAPAFAHVSAADPVEMRHTDPTEQELLTEAIELLKSGKSQKVSTSLLQRRLRIGYNRAADLIASLEKMGVVGPETDGKPREILVDLATYTHL